MKHIICLATLTSLVAFATPAFASELGLGLGLRLSPTGRLKVAAGGESASTDTATMYGAIGHLDLDLGPNFSIGLAPQVLMNVRGKGSNADSATQIDLLARVMAKLPVSDQLSLFAYGSPGWSIISLPNNSDENPSGFVLDGGLGARFGIGPKLALDVDLGYQVGFQYVSVQGGTVDITTKFVHLGVGLSTTL